MFILYCNVSIHSTIYPIHQARSSENSISKWRRDLFTFFSVGQVKDSEDIFVLKECYHFILLLAITSRNIYVLVDVTLDAGENQYLLSIRNPKNRFKTVYMFQISPGQMSTKFYH